MTKRKIKIPDNPADCVTISQQVQYSLRLREIYEQQVLGPGWSSPPSALWDFYERHPVIEGMPWTSITFAEDWTRQERTRREILRTARDEKK